MMSNWDIHPEMVTHTRIIDTKTGHPYPEISPRFMENWDWCNGRSTDEIADYMSYALTISQKHRPALRRHHHARRLRQQSAAAARAGVV
jgi:hypothetical protein